MLSSVALLWYDGDNKVHYLYFNSFYKILALKRSCGVGDKVSWFRFSLYNVKPIIDSTMLPVVQRYQCGIWDTYLVPDDGKSEQVNREIFVLC